MVLLIDYTINIHCIEPIHLSINSDAAQLRNGLYSILFMPQTWSSLVGFSFPLNRDSVIILRVKYSICGKIRVIRVICLIQQNSTEDNAWTLGMKY